MKLVLATIGVLAARLALASLVFAQIAGDDPTPPAIPARIEIGAVSGLTIIFPEAGALVSIPAGGAASVEVVATRMGRVLDAPAHLLAQAQVRVAFRPHLRSRKSLVVGLTRIRAIGSAERFFETDHEAFVRPHVGTSLQWPVAPALDLRFDAMGIVTFASEFPMIPRATVGVSWHPRGR
jgi:hypothetical protein